MILYTILFLFVTCYADNTQQTTQQPVQPEARSQGSTNQAEIEERSGYNLPYYGSVGLNAGLQKPPYYPTNYGNYYRPYPYNFGYNFGFNYGYGSQQVPFGYPGFLGYPPYGGLY